MHPPRDRNSTPAGVGDGSPLKATLGKAGSRSISIDVPRLLETRLLLTASSGGGKSWAIRRLIEQVANDVMVLVIDPEGEFATLREKLDLVIAGKGGDCPAEPQSADLLARRLLELGASAVLDIYELKPTERVRFVRKFLEGLVNSPKKLWRPCLVIVDEAHAFAPEKGQAESLAAVVDLMSRGRKRGFAGILATQRLAKLSKDAAAEAINVMVGRFALDLDVRRAAETLGFEKARHQELKRLRPGEFFAFGPALADEVIRMKVGDVRTSHPKAGQRQAAAPAPRAQVRRVLEQLTDLPAEAEEEARTLESARKRVRELERELRQARKSGGPPDEAVIARARREGAAEAERRLHQVVAQHEAGTRAIVRALEVVVPGVEKALDAARAPLEVEISSAPPAPARSPRSVPQARPQRRAAAALRPSPDAAGEPVSLGGGCGRMLAAMAQAHPGGLTEAQWATLSRLKRSGGTWGTYKSRLGTRGLVEQSGGLWRITEEGLDAVGGAPTTPVSSEEVIAQWRAAVGGGAGRLLDLLVERYPDSYQKEELAEEAGLTFTGGTYSTYLSRLRSNGLLDELDGIRASEVLFR